MTTRCPICRGSGRITQTTGYYAGCSRCKATGFVWIEDNHFGGVAGTMLALLAVGLVVVAMLLS